jgi:hypothetical protein
MILSAAQHKRSAQRVLVAPATDRPWRQKADVRPQGSLNAMSGRDPNAGQKGHHRRAQIRDEARAGELAGAGDK